jgi:hypothetical protein
MKRVEMDQSTGGKPFCKAQAIVCRVIIIAVPEENGVY